MYGCNVRFIGGDKRQLYCAKALYDMGYEVSAYGFDNADDIFSGLMIFSNLKIAAILADVIVLPTPCIKDGFIYMPLSSDKISIDELFKLVEKDKTIFGGFGKSIFNYINRNEYKAYNFLANEELTIYNAHLTAEGAVNILMNTLDEGMQNQRVLITGYGRIAKALSKILGSLNAKVTVAARKKADLAWAKFSGADALMLKNIKSLKDYDIVINTVPAPVIDNRLFAAVNNRIVMELATDSFIEAKDNVFIKANGIPGKYAPKDCGRMMAAIIDGEMGGLCDD